MLKLVMNIWHKALKSLKNMHRTRIVFRWIFHIIIFREYAEEALKQAKVFSEVAKEIFEKVATETVNSKLSQSNNCKYRLFIV